MSRRVRTGVSQAASTLPEACIAVIGAGIIGLSIAWRLASEGWRVAVFEKNLAGNEASWAAAGMLSPGGEIDRQSPFAELANQSRRLYSGFIRDLEQASGLAIDYQECGALDTAYSAEELHSLEQRAAIQADAGIESKEVSASQISTFWPRIRREGLAGGRFYPNDAIVNPREIMVALAAACAKSNVALVQNCAVERVEVGKEAIRVYAASCSRSYGATVLAAGAWSSQVVIEGVPRIAAAEPVKGHLIGYQQPQQVSNSIVRHGHIYALQRANGLLIVGSSEEHAGFDRDVRPEIVAGLREQASFILPHLGDIAPSETWAGFRPASDALHIEAWHSERLYLAYGHYRNGILLAPVTANRIAAAISANLRTH